MQEQLEHSEWKGTTGGMPWMQRSLVWLLANIDQRVFYAILTLIVPFYMLFAHFGYIAQYHFFKERFGEPWWKAFCHVYLNHFRFGQVIIDRFAAYGGKKFRFNYEDYELWERAEAQDDGFVAVCSHTGNYEMTGYSLRSMRKKYNALVYLGETETVMKNRARMFSGNNIEMVPVMADMSHIFTLNTALGNGEIVSMPGDRIFGSQKFVAHKFLGKEARFPVGAFTLAASRGCQALAVFCMKEDWQTYRIIVRELSAGKAVKRNEVVENLSGSFAKALEEIVHRYPTQWFNYFDFWQITND